MPCDSVLSRAQCDDDDNDDDVDDDDEDDDDDVENETRKCI